MSIPNHCECDDCESLRQRASDLEKLIGGYDHVFRTEMGIPMEGYPDEPVFLKAGRKIREYLDGKSQSNDWLYEEDFKGQTDK